MSTGKNYFHYHSDLTIIKLCGHISTKGNIAKQRNSDTHCCNLKFGMYNSSYFDLLFWNWTKMFNALWKEVLTNSKATEKRGAVIPGDSETELPDNYLAQRLSLEVSSPVKLFKNTRFSRFVLKATYSTHSHQGVFQPHHTLSDNTINCCLVRNLPFSLLKSSC